jgi:hypothetical protein
VAASDVATLARLHREGRFDRSTRTVEAVTGRPAQSVEAFVAARAASFVPAHRADGRAHPCHG